MLLSMEQIAQYVERSEGWSREDGKWLVKKYRFPAFLQGIDFVNRVAAIAEELNHHPMIAVDFRLVTLRLTTWSAGGLTELDVRSAERFDAAYMQIKS